MLAVLNAACAIPIPWQWPHVQRLPYLTWNLAPDKRLPILEGSLRRGGPGADLLRAAANAAKEVEPRRAVELGLKARELAREHDSAPQLAWSTFVLSFAFRWLGDLEAAAAAAAELSDGVDALAGPQWVAWGHFESAALAAMRGELSAAADDMVYARATFTAAGSIFTYDAWCGLIAIHRAAGDLDAQRSAYNAAASLLHADPLRDRFKRDILLVEDGEYARACGDLSAAEQAYRALLRSPTLAQELLGWLGLGEVQRARGQEPVAAWRALERSDETGFGYGQVHAAVTLGLAGRLTEEDAERRIAESHFNPPASSQHDGLLRFCQGPTPERHVLCFP
jgi:tetratricopeptide (TPR) repeat protein